MSSPATSCDVARVSNHAVKSALKQIGLELVERGISVWCAWDEGDGWQAIFYFAPPDPKPKE